MFKIHKFKMKRNNSTCRFSSISKLSVSTKSNKLSKNYFKNFEKLSASVCCTISAMPCLLKQIKTLKFGWKR